MAGPVEDEKCLIFVKENFYFSNEICSRLSYVTSNSIYSWWGPILCTVKMQKAHFILSFKTGDRVGDFLEGAKDGAIFISFGSILQGSAMSDDRRRLFLNVFRFFSFSVLLSSFFSFFSFFKIIYPHPPHPPPRERDRASVYRNYWKSVKGCPILAQCKFISFVLRSNLLFYA